MLNNVLNSGKCFKFVCGAGNNDIKSVIEAVKIYSMAGADLIDIAADFRLIKSVIGSLEGLELKKKPLICVSIGLNDDKHFLKAKIDNFKCNTCNKCLTNCPQRAIQSGADAKLKIVKEKCIGCAHCLNYCNVDAICMIKGVTTDYKKILPEIIALKIDCIELHGSGENLYELYDIWKYLNTTFNGMLSICVDDSFYYNKTKFSLLKKMLSERKPYTTILQADGNAMSGFSEEFDASKKAVETAKLFQNAGLNCYMMLSGGTNKFSIDLAYKNKVQVNGVSIGMYARNLINTHNEKDRLKLASELVNYVKSKSINSSTHPL